MLRNSLASCYPPQRTELPFPDISVRVASTHSEVKRQEFRGTLANKKGVALGESTLAPRDGTHSVASQLVWGCVHLSCPRDLAW